MMGINNYYPNYIPAAMLYNSSPGYNFQLRGYPHNYLVPVSHYYYYYYYPDNYIVADSQQYHYHMNQMSRFPDPSRSFQDPNGRESYSLRVLAYRENMSYGFGEDPGTTSWRRTSWIDSNTSRLRVVAADGRRRRVVYRDADATNLWRTRIDGLNVPNRRVIFRNSNGFRVLHHRERETRRCHGSQDAQTTKPWRKTTRKFPVRKPLQISNFPKRRRISRDPSHFQALSTRKRKRLPPWIALRESSLEDSNFPKRRWTSRNPSNLQAFPLRKTKRLPPWVALRESSLQVPAFQKRRSKRLASRDAPRESSFQVPDFQKRRSKRLAPRVAIRESTLQVPAFQKRRTHKFRKWFPLRLSNQWMKRSHKSYTCFRCKKPGHFAIRCPQNMCYKCKKQGHFAIRCPQNMANNNSSLSSSVSVFVEKDGLEYAPPSLLCQCGLRCSLGTRKKNNRKVYTCPLKSCKTFRWEDEVKKDELISVPRCLCGAGFCRQYTESGGTEVGRKYFACPIKKGQGACRFSKFLNDESLTNNIYMDERISPPRFTFSGNFPTNNVQKEIRSHVLDTVEYYPNQKEISGNQEVELMEVDLGCKEDTSNKTPKKCNKRLRDGAPKYGWIFSNTVAELVSTQSYSERGDTEGVVHVRKSMCLRQSPIEENVLAARTTSHSCSYTSVLLPLREDWLITAAMNLNMELFKGWWGRLAYPPAPSLKPPEKKPFYCCVFPSFDPIFVHQIVDEVDWQSRNRQNPEKNIEGSLMFGSISDQFARVARDLQKKLIYLLKSSDFRAHEYMAGEANITFTALDQLQVQSKPFRERVNKLIQSASILDKAEGSINPKDQYSDYQDHNSKKKRKRDDLISDYDLAKADMETCKERFHSPSEETSCKQSRLFQVEARVSSCEAEKKYHESCCAQISVDLIESEKRIRVAEEDLRHLQQKKEDYNAAEAAYKKARIELGILTDK